MNKVLLRGFFLCVSASVWASNASHDAVLREYWENLEDAISLDMAAIQNKFDPSGDFVPTPVKTIKTIFYGPKSDGLTVAGLFKALATSSPDGIAARVRQIETLNKKLAEDPLRSLPRGVNSSYLVAWQNFKQDAVPHLLKKDSSRGSSGYTQSGNGPSYVPHTDDERYAAFVLYGNPTKAQVLGLTEAEYRDPKTRDKAYKGLALRWHPDKNREQAELATQVTQLINWAAGK